MTNPLSKFSKHKNHTQFNTPTKNKTKIHLRRARNPRIPEVVIQLDDMLGEAFS